MAVRGGAAARRCGAILTRRITGWWLFDQRGCGRSRPHASVEANTTWHLVADIERIRADLGIDQFVLFGGSWGATLALIYAISHPDCVSAMVFARRFSDDAGELDWFYGGGAGAFYPELWARFLSVIPEEERGDLLAAYHQRLFSGVLGEETRAARAWAGWENALASVHGDGAAGDGPAEYARAFSRLENHYFVNAGFLEQDGWILANAARIAEIPATIVQGRFDMICPPVSAFKLAQALPKSRLPHDPTGRSRPVRGRYIRGIGQRDEPFALISAPAGLKCRNRDPSLRGGPGPSDVKT